MTAEFFQQVTDNFKRIEQERDEAIRTKAHISDRKTATAMNSRIVGTDTELKNLGAAGIAIVQAELHFE